MHKSKLVQILKTLSTEEFRRFRKILVSPFFTSNENLLQLYVYLKKYHPDFNSSKLTKEKIFQKLFPNRPYNDNVMRILMKDFTKVLEEYLLQLQLKDDAYDRKKRLVKIYGERNLFDHFERGSRELLQEIENSPYRDVTYYKEQIELNEARYFHPLFNRFDLDDSSLELVMEGVDSYFALAKFKYGNELMNRGRVFQKSYDLKFIETVSQEHKNGFLDSNPLFQLYLLLYQIMTKGNTERFEEFEPIIFEKLDGLRRDDQRILFFHSLNFIVRQANSGNAEFSRKAFEWNKLGLKLDLMVENGKIEEAIFGNIANYGCREQEFDWTERFIEAYQIYLPENIRIDVVNLNLGTLYFYKKDFQQSISTLLNYQFSPVFQLRSKLTLIRSLFEQFLLDNNYFDVLVYHIKAFEKYINRNEYYSIERLEPHLNMIRLLNKFADRIYRNEGKQQLEKWFEKQMSNERKLSAKNWLKEKIQQL